MLKKGLYLLILFSLASCWFVQKKVILNTKKIDNKLPAISTWASQWIFVWVSSPNQYSKQWPELLSGSYYFDPMNFFISQGNTSIFQNAYSSVWHWNKVYYYDENDGAQAGLVVYVLRNIYHKKNVSLLENAKLKSNLHYTHIFHNIYKENSVIKQIFTWWFIWSWKYVIVYDISKIKFNTWDLLLFSSDLWTAKETKIYKNWTGINIKNFDWTKLLTFYWNLKSFKKTISIISPLNLQKYKKVFIYYPKYRYRSGVLALYLQQYFK